MVNWRREVILDDVRSVVAFRDRMLKGAFLGAIHLAEPGLQLPDEESRTLARSGMQARTGNGAPVALVIFGQGFGASAIRSVGTAIFALRAGPSTRIFSAALDASLWLAEQTADEVDAQALAEACDELRKAGAGR